MRGNPWRRVLVTVCAMVFVLLVAASYRFLDSRGLFTTVKPVSPGICRTITGVAGASDIAVDPPSKTAFIAAAARTPSVQDGLYAYAYDTPGARPVKLAGTPKDFHPTALALVHDPDGTVFLNVIFRRATSGFSMSLFKVKADAVEELGRLSTDVLTDPSAIAAVDTNRFYVINRHATHSALGRWLDDTFLLPRANVLYFDGMKFVTVAGQLNSPSGIALSRDARTLFVTEDYPRTLVRFTRNEFSGALQNPTVQSISSGLQKITVASDDSVWIAAQPKGFAVSAYRRNPSKPAPSQVYRVQNGTTASLVYAGTDIGAADTAAVAGSHLFIGSSLDTKLLDCSL